MCSSLNYFNKFWGMDLPTATVFIGWLSFLISLLQILIYGFILGFYRDIVSFSIIPHVSEFLNEIGHFKEEELRVGLTLVVCILMGICILDLFTSLGLIFGAQANSEYMVFPWLVRELICMTVRLSFSLLMTFAIFTRSEQAIYIQVLIVLIIWVINVISVWIWFAVYSYFHHLNLIEKTQDQEIK